MDVVCYFVNKSCSVLEDVEGCREDCYRCVCCVTYGSGADVIWERCLHYHLQVGAEKETQ